MRQCIELRVKSMLTTNIAHLPLAYQCAIEIINNGERTKARLLGLFDHFETVYGMKADDSGMLTHWRDSAIGIASRRYWNFDQA